MRLLAIECATEACSAALFEDGALIGGRFEKLGRGHAERLVPMIAELPDRGRAQQILVSLGPGSFTGIRIGIAAARALALAWHAEVLGYHTLALVAAQARIENPASAISVRMKGGHGEAFVQDFGPDGLPLGELASIPLGALAAPQAALIAGNLAGTLPEAATGAAQLLDILPDAREIAHMPRDVFTKDLRPLYGRAPDAKVPGAK